MSVHHVDTNAERLSGGRAVVRAVRRDGPRRRPARYAVSVALALTLASQAAVGSLFAAPARAESGSVMMPTAEITLLTLTNQARAVAGLRALKRDATLGSVGDWRSSDMLARDYFSHAIPPDDRLVFSELDRRRYCYRLAGENIGWNTNPAAETVARVQGAFMDSPTHRANILGRSWDAAGVGAWLAPSGKWMYTVLFAQRCAKK